MANDRCIKLKKVIEEFDSIPKKANLESFKGKPLVANMVESHIQGYAQHEKDSKSYYIMSHNNKGYSKGFYMVNTKDNSAKKYESYDENFNHPGGIQMIGDYLFCAVENSSHNKSHIRLYNLENIKNGSFAIESNFDIDRNSKGAGYVGITNSTVDGKETFTLAVGDKKRITIYKADANTALNTNTAKDVDATKIKLPDAKFKEVFEADLKHDYHGMGLVTDAIDERIFLIGFRKDGNKDLAELYHVDFSNRQIKQKSSGHFTNSYGSTKGSAGVHFRWGTGVHIKNDNRLVLLATARNYVGGKIDTNWWV